MRIVLALVISGSVLSCAMLQAEIEPAPTSDRAMLGGNLARTGEWKTPAIREIKGIKWSFETARRYDGIRGIDAFPVVAQELVVFGANDHHVYALERNTGKLVWRFDTGDRVDVTPAIAGDTVYVGNVRFYAIDLRTGKEKWRFNTPWSMRSSAAVSYGMVYFGCADGCVYALDQRTGNLAWRFRAHSLLRPIFIDAAPTIVDGMLYVGSVNGTMYALNALTGKTVWDFRVPDNPRGDQSVIYQPAAAGNGKLFFESTGNVYALNLNDGKVVWRNPARRGAVPSFSHGIVLYVNDMPREQGGGSVLNAVDAETGQVKWQYQPTIDPQLRYPLNVNRARIRDAVSIAEGVIYLTEGPIIRALDLLNGKPIWSYELKEWPPVSDRAPTIDNGVLYVGTSKGILYAIH